MAAGITAVACSTTRPVPPDLQVLPVGGAVAGTVEAGDQAALAVAVDPDGVLAEAGQPVQRLAGQA